ncbi:FkbM family methyltransferase [Gelidibacter sediminis]|uniref:FkbM family methyltransferase n=1 Tax=Gelidibacter sediminis TaxID=1608710 RepID=A0A4R7PKT3_9FLAO|nr:FkbM family methyltransferase [Gelidibacter sediminis]TDU34421.1 FkbM family methyltransferase [Gelidibacter sediminis]
MKILYEFIFRRLSTKTKNRLGSSHFFKPLRDVLLRNNGRFKEIFVEIEKYYLEYPIKFRYYASIKSAIKARDKGVENTILRNSIILSKQLHKSHDDCIVIDVGSNFGFMSMVWGLSICKKGTVHSFEANKNVYNSFLKSLDHNNLKNIILRYNAIGKTNKTVKMYHMDTTSNFNKTNNTDKYDMVQMLTLDSYDNQNQLGRCDIIKIDVDGIEYDILQGSLEVMERYQPLYIVETNDDPRIIDFFITNNYHILDMALEPYILNTQLPPNIFCLPK